MVESGVLFCFRTFISKIQKNLSNDDAVEEEDEVNSLSCTYRGPFLSAQGNKAKVKSKEFKLWHVMIHRIKRIPSLVFDDS